MGLRAPDDHLWAPEGPFPARFGLPRAPTAGPRAGPKRAQNHQKRGPAAPRRAPGVSTVRVHGAESTRVMCGPPLWRGVFFCPKMVAVGSVWVRAQPGPEMARNHQNTWPGTSESGAGGIRCPRSGTESTRAMSGLPFWFASTYFCPQRVSVGPTWARSGPGSRFAVQNQRSAVSQARWTETPSRGHFWPRANPHFGWLPHLRMAQMPRQRRVLPTGCLFGPHLGCVGPRRQ